MSDRERTVLLLAAEGLTDKQIAKHLNLSQRTIGTYWERMRQKLGPYSRTQLVARFLRHETEADPDALSYGGLFASWEEGVWILSPSGETIYANRRVATLFGFTQEQFQAMDARDFLEQATSATLEEVVEAAKQEPHKIDFRLQRPDGSAVWLGIRASVVTDANRVISAVVLLVQDLTVLKRVKHTLDSCESALSFLAEHSSDLIARFDGHLRCLSMNQSFLQILGLTADDVVNKTVPELKSILEPNVRWIRYLEQALSTGKPQSFTCNFRGIQDDLRTHLLPEPSPEFLPATIMTITTLAGTPTTRRK